MLFLVSQVKQEREYERYENIGTNENYLLYFPFVSLFSYLSSSLFLLFVDEESGLVAQVLGFWHLFNGS
jgi:hypothetical protein